MTCQRVAFVLSAIAVFAASPCRAGFEVLVGDVVKLTDGTGNSGGIFHADVLYRTAASPDFDTFCVEVLEHITLGQSYYVDSVGLTTKSATIPIMTLTSKAAWLYTQFDEGLQGNANGLTGFNFSTPTSIYADALQLGIWRELNPGWSQAQVEALPGPWTTNYIDNVLEPILYDATNGWLSVNYANDAGWLAGGANFTGSVMIMNLYKYAEVSNSATGPDIREITLADGSKKKIKLKADAQDQLFRIPPSMGSIVPELTTFCMAGSVFFSAAVAGLVSGHRRRQ